MSDDPRPPAAHLDDLQRIADDLRDYGLPETAEHVERHIGELRHRLSGMEARVLEWLRGYHEGASFEVTGVESVEADGTDYAGDTEGGFYSTFRVTLTYTTTDPSRPTLHLTVEGDHMESLWRHVVGGEA